MSSDGEHVGDVKHLILDPETEELKSLVVEHGMINRESKTVPAALVDQSDSKMVSLRISQEEFELLPDFISAEYTAPPPGYTVPLSYPGGGLLWPINYTPAAPPAGSSEAMMQEADRDRLRERDADNAVIDTDSDVMSRDGEKIGEVEALSMDTITGKPGRFVVRKGFFFTENLELPVSTIASLDDGIVTLNLDKDEALKMAVPVKDA